MKETKISYYKIQYQLYKAEICFPEKKNPLLLLKCSQNWSWDKSMAWIFAIKSASSQFPRQTSFQQSNLGCRFCSVWLLMEVDLVKSLKYSSKCCTRASDLFIPSALELAALPGQVSGSRSLLHTVSNTSLQGISSTILIDSLSWNSSHRAESKLHSASNKIPQEQCTLGVEGEKELINENEDENCYISMGNEALSEDNCTHSP